MKILPLIFLAASLTKGFSEQGNKPNVILVMCDDLGWGDVGFNNNEIIKTPHLDSMAKSGMRFNRFYAAAPVCSPTRGSVMTGRHPFRYGIFFANTGHLKKKELTLAELLKEKGYRTGHFGKWHLGTLSKEVVDANRGGSKGIKHYSPPQENGFEVCFSTESKVPTWDPMWVPKTFTGGSSRRLWWDPKKDASTMKSYGTRYWDHEGKQVIDNLRGGNSRVIMDRAVPFIESSAKEGNPFLAVIWFHTPHLPVVAGPRHSAMYKQFSNYKKHYYGCITAMDEQIGRLRQTLKKIGITKNTMLWFCSDNGPEGNNSAPGKTGGFRGRKRSLYEGGVRVPSVLEWPAKVEPNSSTDFPSGTVDYLPTILGAIGMEMPDVRPTDGIDLIPVIEGKMKERSKAMGFQSGAMASYVTHRYKLVSTKATKKTKPKNETTPNDSQHLELYDLLEDPYEKNNIASENVTLLNDLKAKLETWKESCSLSNEGKDYRNQKGNNSQHKEL